MTIDDIVENARLPLREALVYLEEHKEEVEGLYSNAYFECTLNVYTRNPNDLTDVETLQTIESMRYFLTKETRYTSDSAIVCNFLLSPLNSCRELEGELEKYLYKKDTSYSFKYFMITKAFLDIETRLFILEPIYESILIKGGKDVETLCKYIAHLKKTNHIYEDNEVIDRILNSTKGT